jgi:hypothetical protein
MSSSKTLSNGTLSLRFMQNAQRAKHQAEVEAAQAKVKDDAEWEVPAAVRAAWGATSSKASSADTGTNTDDGYVCLCSMLLPEGPAVLRVLLFPSDQSRFVVNL